MRRYHSWSTWTAAQPALSERLAPDTVGRLGTAYRFAADRHAGQTRPAGEPYHEHLLETLEILLDSGAADRVSDGDAAAPLVAALLHDVVEDTACTLDDVRRRFGPDVAAYVDWLTRPEPPAGADPAAEREKYLARFATAPEPVLAVKLSDRYSNVQRLHTYPDPAGRRRYYAETVAVFLPLAARIPFFADLFTTWAREYRTLARD